MKKHFITTILIIAMTLAVTACGTGQTIEKTEPESQPAEIQTDKEDFAGSENPLQGESYTLSMIEYDYGNGEYVPADFVPGAETFTFKDDGSYDYSYRNYPTYEDMVNDRNYEVLSVHGNYEVDGASITLHGTPMGEETFEKNNASSEWTIDGDDIILIVRDKSGQAPGSMRSTYTKEQ